MLLLLDSSGAMLVAALAGSDGIVAARAVPSASPAGRDIGAVVAALLGSRSMRDVTAIGVGVGPGSFIGTRVAVSFANGIAAAGGVPVHGIPTLAALVAGSGGGGPLPQLGAAGQSEPCAPTVGLRDARRGEAYLYAAGTALDAARLVALADLAHELRGCTLVIAESPAPDDKRGAEWTAAVESAAHAAGVEGQLHWATHVPPAGLLALLPHCPAREIAEPVYLRGFL